MLASRLGAGWVFPRKRNNRPPRVGRFITLDDSLREKVGTCARRRRVLIEGETGTGKGLLARVMHELARPRTPFVVVDCAALPQTLAEAELFGHRRGAYTGCSFHRAGLLEQSDGGTVFLDEITDLPAGLQGRLLRFLEEGQIRRLGENSYRKVNACVIAASNRDVSLEAQAGRFRKDLLYRLRGAYVAIPPLRKRPGDLFAIARELLERQARSAGKTFAVSAHAVELLRAHSWPGNVRELKYAIEDAVTLLNGGTVIGEKHLFPALSLGEGSSPYPNGDGLSLDGAVRDILLERLRGNGWDYRKTWRSLKIPRSTFYRKLKRYGISRPRDRSSQHG